MAALTTIAAVTSAVIAGGALAHGVETSRQAKSDADENKKQMKIASDKAEGELKLNKETEKQRSQTQKAGRAALREQGKTSGREGTILGDFSSGSGTSEVKTLLGQ